MGSSSMDLVESSGLGSLSFSYRLIHLMTVDADRSGLRVSARQYSDEDTPPRVMCFSVLGEVKVDLGLMLFVRDGFPSLGFLIDLSNHWRFVVGFMLETLSSENATKVVLARCYSGIAILCNEIVGLDGDGHLGHKVFDYLPRTRIVLISFMRNRYVPEINSFSGDIMEARHGVRGIACYLFDVKPTWSVVTGEIWSTRFAVVNRVFVKMPNQHFKKLMVGDWVSGIGNTDLVDISRKWFVLHGRVFGMKIPSGEDEGERCAAWLIPQTHHLVCEGWETNGTGILKTGMAGLYTGVLDTEWIWLISRRKWKPIFMPILVIVAKELIAANFYNDRRIQMGVDVICQFSSRVQLDWPVRSIERWSGNHRKRETLGSSPSTKFNLCLNVGMTNVDNGVTCIGFKPGLLEAPD